MTYDRVLVIANETIAGRQLHQEIKEITGAHAKVRVIAPALTSRFKYMLSDIDGARAQAQERLAQSLEMLGGSGIEADGEVGDGNPVRAFEDACAEFEPDYVIVSTHPQGRSNWLENGVVEKIRAKTSAPVEHVVVDLEAEQANEPSGTQAA